jgi:putative endonuclease
LKFDPGGDCRRLVGAMSWSVYLVRCTDGTVYCGIAVDVGARIAAHEAGRGARYTRGRGPLQLLATRRCRDQGTALRIERAVKRLPRPDKLALADAPARFKALVRTVRRSLGERSVALPRGASGGAGDASARSARRPPIK